MRVLKILTGLALFVMTFLSQASIQAVGLMPGMAILEKDGQRLVIKAGQEKQGITLIQADSEQCVIEINGARKTLLLGASLASNYAPAQVTQVRLKQDFSGHYYANVQLNGRSVRMLVDTGATNVALSGNSARRLGIAYGKGERRRSATAGGIVDSFLVRVNEIKLQGITRYNVPVSVIAGAHPSVPLLGMSFLGQLKIQQDNNELLISE